MKIKNKKETGFVLVGAFKDNVDRAVLVPASGEVEFPTSALINNIETKFSHLSETITFEASEKTMEAEEIESATFISNIINSLEVPSDAKPFINLDWTANAQRDQVEFREVKADLFKSNGLGIEDITSFILPHVVASS